MAINFAMMIVVARLLTPEEFGVAVLGNALWGMCALLSELGQANFIIQRPDLTGEHKHTAFTLTLIATFLVGGGLAAAAHPIAEFYRLPGLEPFLYVSVAALLMHVVITPALAILRRNMAFAPIAAITIVSACANALATIVLALNGFSYMSIAWATLISTTLAIGLCFAFAPGNFNVGFSVKDWRQVAHFGVLDMSKNLLYYVSDTVPYLIFGRLLSADAVGIYQRAVTISRLPERFLLSGTVPVLLPAFSRHVREGSDLQSCFLKGVEYVTGVLWPALLLVVILAHHIVWLLLGDQWLSAAPYVQIIAGSFLFMFQMCLANPILIAAGHIRDTVTIALITVPITIATQWVASLHGLDAVAWSMFFTVPMYVLVSIFYVKLRIPFRWIELLAAMKKSFVVAAMSAAGPLAMSLAGELHPHEWHGAAIAGILALLGWVAGLWVTDHLLHNEMARVRNALTNAVTVLRERVLGA